MAVRNIDFYEPWLFPHNMLFYPSYPGECVGLLASYHFGTGHIYLLQKSGLWSLWCLVDQKDSLKLHPHIVNINASKGLCHERCSHLVFELAFVGPIVTEGLIRRLKDFLIFISSPVVRIPVIGVSDQARHKPGYTTTENS